MKSSHSNILRGERIPIRVRGRKSPAGYLTKDPISEFDIHPKNATPENIQKIKKKTLNLMRGGESTGITTFTKIQKMVIPAALEGYDIIGKSSTGSGKTLSFIIPIIEKLTKKNIGEMIGAVILCPTKELASQIAEEAIKVARHHDMNVKIVNGITSERQDIASLTGSQKIHILVATPGRLESLLKSSGPLRTRFSGVSSLVLDEADRMLDPGFKTTINKIRNYIKTPTLQTYLFSATIPETIRKTLMDFSSDRVKEFDSGVVGQSLKILDTVYTTPIEKHFEVLLNIINKEIKVELKGGGDTDLIDDAALFDMFSEQTKLALKEWPKRPDSGYRIMVFMPSNAMVDHWTKSARSSTSLDILSMHGNMDSKKRNVVFENFRTKKDQIMFTSDASSRGVDYPGVTSVIQLGFTTKSEFVQRRGRTGRAGKTGSNHLLIDGLEAEKVKRELKDFGDITYIDDFKSTEPYSLLSDRKHAFASFKGWVGALVSRRKAMGISMEEAIDLSRRFALENRDAIGVDNIERVIKKKLGG